MEYISRDTPLKYASKKKSTLCLCVRGNLNDLERINIGKGLPHRMEVT